MDYAIVRADLDAMQRQAAAAVGIWSGAACGVPALLAATGQAPAVTAGHANKPGRRQAPAASKPGLPDSLLTAAFKYLVVALAVCMHVVPTVAHCATYCVG